MTTATTKKPAAQKTAAAKPVGKSGKKPAAAPKAQAPTKTQPATKPAKAPAKAKAKGPAKGNNRAKRIFPVDPQQTPFKSGASLVTWKMIVADPGKTFAEYIAAGARANTVNFAIRNKWVRLQD